MILFGGSVGKNKAWEICFLHVVRSFSDGVDWFELKATSDWYDGDHNPQFTLRLIVMNLTVVEFSLYDTRHKAVE